MTNDQEHLLIALARGQYLILELLASGPKVEFMKRELDKAVLAITEQNRIPKGAKV